MPLFHRRQIDEAQALSLALAEARRRGWSWSRPEVVHGRNGLHVRLRPEEMESPYVLVGRGGAIRVGFEERYLDDEGGWHEGG